MREARVARGNGNSAEKRGSPFRLPLCHGRSILHRPLLSLLGRSERAGRQRPFEVGCHGAPQSRSCSSLRMAENHRAREGHRRLRSEYHPTCPSTAREAERLTFLFSSHRATSRGVFLYPGGPWENFYCLFSGKKIP